MTIENRASKFWFWRDFYSLEQKGQELKIEVVTLNFFQRAFRMIFGWYENTILDQKKINFIGDVFRSKADEINSLVDKINAFRPEGKKFDKVVDPVVFAGTVLVVGKTRTGKSTAIEGLAEYTKIAPAGSIFAKTEEPKVYSVEVLAGKVLRVVDTPGFFEVRKTEEQHKKRTNEQLTQVTQEVVQKTFGGKGFQNVGKAIFTMTSNKLDEEQIKTIFTYSDLLGAETQKILLVTHAEGFSDDIVESTKAQIYNSFQHGERLRKIFGDNVLFIGALTVDDAQDSEEDVMRRMRTRIIPRKQAFLKRLLHGVVTHEEVEQFCRKKSAEFEEGREVFLQSLAPYRKPRELRSLMSSLEYMLKDEVTPEMTIQRDEKKREEFHAELQAFIDTAEGFEKLKRDAVLLKLFLDVKHRKELDAMNDAPTKITELMSNLEKFRRVEWLHDLETRDDVTVAECEEFAQKMQRLQDPFFQIRVNSFLMKFYMKQGDEEKARCYAKAIYDEGFYKLNTNNHDKNWLTEQVVAWKVAYPQFNEHFAKCESILQ